MCRCCCCMFGCGDMLERIGYSMLDANLDPDCVRYSIRDSYCKLHDFQSQTLHLQSKTDMMIWNERGNLPVMSRYSTPHMYSSRCIKPWRHQGLLLLISTIQAVVWLCVIFISWAFSMWWMTEHPILFNLLGRGGGVFIPVSVYVARQNFILLCVCVPVGTVVNSI